MNHYAGQGLEREPFSSSPDPNFLVETKQHATCLQELELSLRLRRGLNVVTGDIGAGKTTLCRSLLRAFATDQDTDVHLLLDPHFESCEEFVRVILTSVSGVSPEPDAGLWQLKEALKQQLFRLGLVEKRLVILIIDEGQKISPENLEILREMLNYETNTSKLLQIVLFGQKELEPVLASMPNLADRINVRRRLAPLRLAETRRMIQHRLAVAAGEGGNPRVRFTALASLAIHLAAGGSPRRIVRLCHMALLEMLVRGKDRVGLGIARAVARPAGERVANPRRAAALAAAAVICLSFGALWLSLGPSGPVLGALDRQPAATAPAEFPPQPLPRAAQGPETREASLAPEGVTLLPEGEDAAQGPASRLSLLPQRDQGPDVRERVGQARPDVLHVALPQSGAAAVVQARAELSDAAAGRPLAQAAAYSPDRP